MSVVYRICLLAVVGLVLSLAVSENPNNKSEGYYPAATGSYSTDTTPTVTSNDQCVCDCEEYLKKHKPKHPPHPPPHPPPPPPPPHHKNEIPSYYQKYFTLEDNNNDTCLNISMAIIFSIAYEMLENYTSTTVNFEVPEDITVSGTCPRVYQYSNGIVTYRANVTIAWEDDDFVLTFIFLTFFTGEPPPTTAPPPTEAPHNSTPELPTFPPTQQDTEPAGIDANPTEPLGFAIEPTQEFQGQQYMSDIIFSYYTGSGTFEDPAEPYGYRTVARNQSYFQTEAGTTYLCNSHTALSLSGDVTMNIKYAVLNPFEYIYKNYNFTDNNMPPVFQCAADFETDNILMVITACCVVGGIVVLVLVSAIIHFATQGTNTHPAAMFKTYKSGYTSFQ